MRIRFKYTISGQVQYFELQPRSIDISVTLDSLRNVGGTGYGYALRTYGEKTYIAKNPNFDGYENLLIYFPSTLRSAVDYDSANSYQLRISNMMYDHSKSIDNLTRYDGQEMTFDGSAGTAEFGAFIRTEIIEGQPVSRYYLPGIFNVAPSGGTYPTFGQPSNVQGVYSTENIPALDCFTFNVSDSGNTFPCLFVAIKGTETAYPAAAYIFDLRMFDGSAPVPTTETGSRTVTPWGRAGTYNFTSDKMLDVPPTGFSVINRWEHGLTLYHINDYQCAAIQKEFWGNDTLWGMWINATVKPIQGVITLHKMPVPISSGSSSRALTIFGRRISSGQLLDQIPLINDQMVMYPSSPQWIPIEEIYGDFFDYAGESQLSVHLPFIGTIPLDINAVMGGAVKTVYYFDLLTGNCIARVYGRNSMLNGAELLLYQGSGNAALHIPYCGNDQGGMKMLGSLAGVATAGLAALAIGGAAAAPAMAAITGTSSAVLREKNATINNIPTECAPLSYPYVCYIMTYPERVLADYELQMQGWRAASGASGSSVSDYKGFTAGYLHADIADATDAEKAEIERYFEGGVIL